MIGANRSMAFEVPWSTQPISGEYSPATRSGARNRWIAAMKSFAPGSSVSAALLPRPVAASSVALRLSCSSTTVRLIAGALSNTFTRSGAASP